MYCQHEYDVLYMYVYRLLPIPGKVAGDMTEIDSPYLCNTKVFQV
jgi:hypothetical protein